MSIKKFEIEQPKAFTPTERSSDVFERSYNKFQSKVQQASVEDATYAESFKSGISQMSAFADIWKISSDIGARHTLDELSVALDKKSFVKNYQSLGIPIDIASEIAEESETEFQAIQRLNNYKRTQQDFKNIADNPFAGYAGMGLGLTADIFFGATAYEGINATAKAFKFNSVSKAINTARGGAAIGAAEGVLWNALANEANQTSGGYELSATLGGALGALAGKLSARSEYADGSISNPIDRNSRTTPANHSDESIAAAVNNSRNYVDINDAELRVSGYRESINSRTQQLNDNIQDITGNIDSLRMQRAELEQQLQSTSRVDDQEINLDERLTQIQSERQSAMAEVDSLSQKLGVRIGNTVDQTNEKDIEGFGEIFETKTFDDIINDPNISKEYKDEAQSISQRISGIEEMIDTTTSRISERDRIKNEIDELDNSINDFELSLNNSREEVGFLQDELVQIESRLDDELIDLSDIKFDNLRNDITRRMSSVEDIADDITYSAQLIANNAKGNPNELHRAWIKAQEEGDSNLTEVVGNTPILDPITQQTKLIKDLSDAELSEYQKLADEFGEGVSKSYNAGHVDVFLHASADIARNSDSNTVRKFGRDFLGVRGLQDDQVNTISASEHKETFFQAYRNRFYQSMQNNYESYLKDTLGKEASFFDKTFAQFRDNYKQFNDMVGEHQLIVQTNPDKAATFPQSVIKASNELSSMLGEAKLRIRENGWDEGDIFEVSGKPVSFMSRVIDKDRVSQITQIFGTSGKERFFDAVEGSLIAANPKWALTDAIRRADDIQVKERLQEMLDEIGDAKNISHDKVTEVINLLGNSTRQTRVIAKSMVNNSIRRSQIPNMSVNQNKIQSVDELLEDLSNNSDVLNDLTSAERNLINDVITTHMSRRGNLDSRQSQFYSRLKLDPSYTVKARQLDGRDVDVSYMSMLSTDADSIGHNQFMHLSSSFALSKVGLKNTDEFLKRVSDTNEAIGITQRNKKVKQRESEMLEATRKYFMDEKHFQDSSTFMRVVQIIKKFNSMLLGRLFMNILPEFANTSRVIGADTLNMPVMKNIFSTYTRAVRGAQNDPDLFKSLSAMGVISTSTVNKVISNIETGIADTRSLNNKWGYDTRDMSSRAIDKVDGFADMVNAMMLQTYRPFERVQRSNVGAAAIQGLHNVLNNGGFNTLSKSKQKRALDFGVDQKFFEDLQKSVDAGHFKIRNDGVIEDINVEKMMRESPDFYDRYAATLQKEVSSNILQDSFDKSPLFTNGQLFAVFGQFRSFQLLSINHIMRYDMTRIDAVAATTLVYGTILGGINYAMNEISSGRGDELNLEEAFVNSFRRNGQTALLASLTDTALESLGFDPVFAKASTTGVNSLFTPTTWNTFNEIYKGITAMTAIPFGEDEEKSAQRAMKSFKKLLIPNFPFAHSAADDIIEDLF